MTKEIAERFRAMADLIEKNADEPFGGCMMIFPPGENAKVIQILKLDTDPDGSIFWAEVKTKADTAVAELQQAARGNMAFRR
jgi:hypothetical protein